MLLNHKWESYIILIIENIEHIENKSKMLTGSKKKNISMSYLYNKCIIYFLVFNDFYINSI